MCKCGCNTCGTNNGPLLTESKVKSLLSEGLQYHIDKKVPLFETVYRIGSDKHLSLIREARKMYSRNVINLCEEDEALIKTHLGEFGLYEGESVPLDLPMLNEAYYEVVANLGDKKTKENLDSFEEVQDFMDKMVKRNAISVDVTKFGKDKKQTIKYSWAGDKWEKTSKPYINESMDYEIGHSLLFRYDEASQSEFGMDYDQLGSGEKEWVRDEIDNMSMNEDKIDREKIEGILWNLKNSNKLSNPSDPKKKEALIKKLEKQLSRLNESDSNYPDFDLNKNIRYQDTSISSGMWRYTGKEQGGKGVYRNLNNGQILGFDRSDFDIFRNNLSSHFDISESLNEDKGNIPTQDQVDKFFSDTQNEMHYLNSKPVAGQKGTLSKSEVEPWDEYDLSNWKSLNRKAELKEDRKYNQEELLRLDLIARRKFDCDYKKCTDEQKDEILKDKVKVGVKEALNEKEGVPHYTKDGKEWKGKLHKMPDGSLMSGDPHDESGSGPNGESEKLYHKEDLVKESLEEKLKGLDGKACWKGYKLAGTKKKGGKTVDNCVPMEEAMATKDEVLDLIARKNFDKDFKDLSEVEADFVKGEAKKRNLDEEDMDINELMEMEIIDENITEAKYQGKTVTLNKPTRGDSKKFKVYVNSGKKNADGSIKVKKVNFGHGGTSAKRPTMSIRKSNPKRRKAFRSRFNCDSPGPKTMARYWSCKAW